MSKTRPPRDENIPKRLDGNQGNTLNPKRLDEKLDSLYDNQVTVSRKSDRLYDLYTSVNQKLEKLEKLATKSKTLDSKVLDLNLKLNAILLGLNSRDAYEYLDNHEVDYDN